MWGFLFCFHSRCVGTTIQLANRVFPDVFTQARVSLDLRVRHSLSSDVISVCSLYECVMFAG